MLNIGTVSAWITVDDVEVPQYDIQYSPDGQQVTCWIASEIDKKFSICWNEPQRLVSMLGRVRVDGTRCGGQFLRQGSERACIRFHAVDTSPTTERPLIFSRLELTDDDVYLNTPVSPELGDIKLEITEVRLALQSRKVNRKGSKTISLAEPDKIHERAKKGSGHRVKFGEEVVHPEIKYRKSIDIRTLGVFVFKYRPLDILQANGIAPIEPKYNVAGVSAEILDLTREDDSDVDRKPDTGEKIRRLEEELRVLKGSERSVAKTKRIKTEVKTEPRNIFQSSEVIDLT